MTQQPPMLEILTTEQKLIRLVATIQHRNDLRHEREVHRTETARISNEISEADREINELSAQYQNGQLTLGVNP